jgi:hypothetical protein
MRPQKHNKLTKLELAIMTVSYCLAGALSLIGLYWFCKLLVLIVP